MFKTKISQLFTLLFLIILASCDTMLDDGRVSEGIIEYEVSYPKTDPSSILADLLPTKMVMKFKDNQFVSDLSAGFGMFKMNVINNSEDKEYSQLVKLINERFVVHYDETSAIKSRDGFPSFTIKETGKTKVIAEYNCKEAIVTIQNDSAETFMIYYTDEINLDESNWFNQFSSVKGVLLEYQVERYNLCTRFKAISVTPQEIDDDVFEVSDEYESLNEEEMNAKMEEIFNNFSE